MEINENDCPPSSDTAVVQADENNGPVNRVSSFTRDLVSAMKEDGLVDSARYNELVSPSDLARKDSNVIYETYRKLAINAVSVDGMFLQNYPGLLGDKEVVLAAVGQNAEALSLASHELRDDEEVFLAAVKKRWSANVYGSRRLRMKYGYLGD